MTNFLILIECDWFLNNWLWPAQADVRADWKKYGRKLAYSTVIMQRPNVPQKINNLTTPTAEPLYTPYDPKNSIKLTP